MPEHTNPDQAAPQPDEPQAETAPINGGAVPEAEPAGSGNRWEPPAGATPTTTPPTEPPAVSGPQSAPFDAPTEPAKPSRFARPSRTALTAGTAAAALVLVGAGGFAVGRATAGDDHHEGFQVDQQWQRDGQVPGAPGEGLPGGQVPGQGTAPGPGDGDDDSSNG